MSATVYASAVVVVVTAVWLRASRHKRVGASLLPPGPPTWPVIGNALDIPRNRLWIKATEWAQLYGGITYLNVFGLSLVFLNTSEVAEDLLDKRAGIYSDKPKFTMAGELCGCGDMVAFVGYGDQARRQRRLMQRAFGPSAIRSYQPLIEFDTRAFLQRLVQEPEAYMIHLRRYAGGLTLHVVYGYRVESDDDPFLCEADECVDLLSNRIASTGSIWFVDVIPALKRVPSWFPGAGFQRNAAVWKAKMEAFVEAPYVATKERMMQGTMEPCFVSNLLEDAVHTPQDEADVKWVANSMYSASIDTTMTLGAHFILAMVLFPDVQHKAQAELDKVVGRDRLPAFSDRSSLPYLENVLSEALRWSAAVPSSLPHRLMEDDVYVYERDGKRHEVFLPKGAFVFANIWAMVNDPVLFPQPERFWPERYEVEVEDEAAKRKRDPRNYVFGFGRRRCPGAHLIESSAWLLIASMLSTLEFGKAVDEQGREVEPDVVLDNAVFRMPQPFKCSIRPRGEHALGLLA